MKNRIRILLADDHNLVRAGIRSLLERVPEFEVVGEAKDGEEAIEKMVEQAPEVVLLDIAMPRMNGLAAAGKISKAHPNIRIIMLSMHASEEYVLQAIRAGASGYIVKGAEIEELKRAIHDVHQGEKYFSDQVSRATIDAYLKRMHRS